MEGAGSQNELGTISKLQNHSSTIISQIPSNNNFNSSKKMGKNSIDIIRGKLSPILKKLGIILSRLVIFFLHVYDIHVSLNYPSFSLGYQEQ